MASFKASLFGKADICCNEAAITPKGSKAQELLFYLVYYRYRHHTREKLAELFWQECSPTQSRSYLRKALWQIQKSIEVYSVKDEKLLIANTQWIQVHPKAEIWIDVFVFEQVYISTCGINRERLEEDLVTMLENTIKLYRGDLLEGHYYEWCLQERDRLKDMLVGMLMKLIMHYEIDNQFEKVLLYAAKILSIDSTYEDAHQYIMLTHYLTGNRAAALRQYHICREKLAEELGVEPGVKIMKLHKKIHANENLQNTGKKPNHKISNILSFEFLDRLKEIEQQFTFLQNQIRREIQYLEDLTSSGDD